MKQLFVLLVLTALLTQAQGQSIIRRT
ncbi:MAG: hypothetical protein JWP27_2870, partial [Flaviaesturariibacter sp.]|nr:hypothetical protein [Flaviaesturariibacter sp.]